MGQAETALTARLATLWTKISVLAVGIHVESLASIMGGRRAAPWAMARHIVEAAFWWPKADTGRYGDYNNRCRSSVERGVDAGQTVEHIETSRN
jgi:hypothetical protein